MPIGLVCARMYSARPHTHTHAHAIMTLTSRLHINSWQKRFEGKRSTAPAEYCSNKLIVDTSYGKWISALLWYNASQLINLLAVPVTASDCFPIFVCPNPAASSMSMCAEGTRSVFWHTISGGAC